MIGVCFDVNVTEPPAPAGPELCAVTATAEAGAGPPKVGSGGGNFTAAWDGYVQTFVDLPYPDGGWTQASLAQEQLIARIEWWPRAGFLDRPVGGQFVGLTASKQQVHLATIERVPELSWNVLNVTAAGAASLVRAVKFIASDNSYGNIAEIKLFTHCAATSPQDEDDRATQPLSGSAHSRSHNADVPAACQAFAGRAGEFCPSVGIARQCSKSGADCSDPNRGGLTRGLSCVESPGQRKTVLAPPHYCQAGQFCPGGSKCPNCGTAKCACPRHNHTQAPCDGRAGLLDTLFCTCSSTNWNGGDFTIGTTCADHTTADGTIRREKRGGGWRLPGVPAD